MDERRPFRWQALFQRARDPVFVLDRRRRVLFVNLAFEQLTGLAPDAVRGLHCRRLRAPAADAPYEDRVAHLLTPTPEALTGRAERVRRTLRRPTDSGPLWYDVDLLPLRQDDEGRFLVGRVVPVPTGRGHLPATLPEGLMALRQRRVGEHTLALLGTGTPRLGHQVRLAAGLRCPVLLLGEPGCGKQTVARLIHLQSSDRERPFAALDCERLPARAVLRLVLDERGPDAPGGIYLRRPDCLLPDVQARLARWLGPLAGGELSAAEASGRPRLFGGTARLDGPLRDTLGMFVIEVPPLRERMADLPGALEWALSRLNDEGGIVTTGLTAAALEMVRSYGWPGNLTELVSVLREARHHARTERIDRDDLPAFLRLAGPLSQPPAVRPIDLDGVLAEAERRLIGIALRRARGVRSQAAELLGINRQRLLRRLEALGMTDAEEPE